MTPTVDALRNEIRLEVGRHERRVSTPFTKEALAAICVQLDCDIDTNSIPSKEDMRAKILQCTDSEAEPERVERSFRKDELNSISKTLQKDR